MGGVTATAMALSRLILPCAALLFVPLLLYLQCSTSPPPLYRSLRSSNSRSDRRSSAGLEAFLAERGTALLHNWSDEELFDRALGSNATGDAIPAAASHNLSRSSYIAMGSKISAKNESTPPPKVAFLFLTTGSLPFEALWNRFFRGHQDLYSIYVHSDPFRFRAFNRSSAFWGRSIPSARTERGAPSLVAAMKRLLASALLDDPRNQFFALISDSCIPLHGFHRLYKRLAASPDRSFLEVITESNLLWSRYTARGESAMLPEVPFAQFAVGSQWFVVTREHARLFVADTALWEKFRAPCLPELAATSCYTEEHYFSTVMRMRDPHGSHGFTLTFVHWPEDTDGHPTTYRAGDVDLGFLRELQAQRDGRFMFARKFHPDCLAPLLRHADAILKH